MWVFGVVEYMSVFNFCSVAKIGVESKSNSIMLP